MVSISDMFPFGTLNNQNFSSFVHLIINENPGNMTSCKNYDIDDIQKIKTEPNSLCLSLFHPNTCSLKNNRISYI